MGLTRTVDPAIEPVTLAEVKDHTHVSGTDSDAVLTILLQAARENVEHHQKRQLITATYELTLEEFPSGPIILPNPPLISVTSISYEDTAGDTQTWASSNYVVDTPDGDAAVKGRIGLATGVTFPVLENVISPVTIRFVAGYGLKATVPDNVKFGLLMLVADLYENRQSSVTGTISGLMPQTAQTLLWPYRVLEIA